MEQVKQVAEQDKQLLLTNIFDDYKHVRHIVND
jgi:hypothetical protein